MTRLKKLFKKHPGKSSLVIVLILGLLLPDPAKIPVEGATSSDWNEDSFWYEPWGISGVHKGVDIFAENGRPVVASSWGIKLFEGEFKRGGKVVILLGPKWRIGYYAHLSSFNADSGRLIMTGERLGNVGNSGNAAGKPPHLHFSKLTLLPYPWRIDSSTQGWKKLFYLNPLD